MFIYVIQNTVNNKVYVGRTIRTPSARWSGHRHSANHGVRHPQLRAMFDDPRPYPAIAKDYGCSRSYVSAVKRGKR